MQYYFSEGVDGDELDGLAAIFLGEHLNSKL
jgi:hypothetical protein